MVPNRGLCILQLCEAVVSGIEAVASLGAGALACSLYRKNRGNRVINIKNDQFSDLFSDLSYGPGNRLKILS